MSCLDCHCLLSELVKIFLGKTLSFLSICFSFIKKNMVLSLVYCVFKHYVFKLPITHKIYHGQEFLLH